jgi:5-methylcytosine-specific restriction protein B
MPERSKEIIVVGYFLSRFGDKNPPSSLKTNKWKYAYSLFFNKLNNGRSLTEFEHSLKNTRDGFDGYFPKTSREGWKDKEGNPAKLPADAEEVYNQFKNLSEDQIYSIIKEYISIKHNNKTTLTEQFSLDILEFKLILNDVIIKRFTSSLLTKPFLLLTGLSGSGKTKLALAFARWIAESKDQYALVPVGADWTNREPVLGYPNSLDSKHYVKPESGVLDILLRAHLDYFANNKNLALCKPHFLILDEMNLSHVERYFADFISTMESGDEIKLYSGGKRYWKHTDEGDFDSSYEVPDRIVLPKNLFIIGTVNIDETTYMFSPKVLDRANTIEFRVSSTEMESFLASGSSVNLDALNGQGANYASEFMNLAARNGIQLERKKHASVFADFFDALQTVGAEFGYRTANEIIELIAFLNNFGIEQNDAYDIAIMQKLLPKLHGSRSKLSKTLPVLIALCEERFPLSLEKLKRMMKNAEDNGFATYAEA